MKKRWFLLYLLVGILSVGYCLYESGGLGPMMTEEPVIITETTLEEMVNISKLSTAKYNYSGIAQYNNEEKQKTICSIKYDAVVKASIDMKDVSFDLDETNKNIYVELPGIEFSAYLQDNSSISFIPSDAKIELSDAIKICEADALKEASASDELRSTAEENLKSTIEALLLPLVQTDDYTIIWK